MTSERLADYQAIGSALLDVAEAQKALVKIEEDLIQKKINAVKEEISFYDDVLSKIVEAYNGTLSFMMSMEKSDYMGAVAQDMLDRGDSSAYFSALYSQLEHDKKMSITREEYEPKVEAYVNALKQATPEATITDVVDTLETTNEKLDNVKDAIEKASYQR